MNKTNNYFILLYVAGVLGEISHARQIALKNLVAHRERNIKTSMMYAMSLSFIIMINVFSFIQLQSFEYYLRQSRGSSFVIFGTQKTALSLDGNILRYNDFLAFNNLLENNSDIRSYVEDSGWCTAPMDRLVNDFNSKISNQGRVFMIEDAKVIAISPNYFRVAEPTFFSIYHEWAWLSKLYSKQLNLLEELYTAYGTQTALLPASYKNKLYISTNIDNTSVDPSVPNPVTIHTSLLKYTTRMDVQPYTKSHHLLPSYMLNNGAGLRMGRYQGNKQNVVVSLPEYLTLTNGIINSIEDVPISKIVVRLKSNLSSDEVDDE